MSDFQARQKKIASGLKAVRDAAGKTEYISRNYEEITDTLKAALAELDKLMKTAANAVGVQSPKFKSRIKPLKSVLDKTLARGKDFGKMADLVGGMILVNTTEEADAILKLFQRKYSSMTLASEHKDGIGKDGKGDAFGYHGSFHIDVKLPQTGVVAELQIMTKKLEKYKGAAHDIYTTYRSAKDIRADVPAGELNASRKLFALGNKKNSKNLREWIDLMISMKLGEFDLTEADHAYLDWFEKETGIYEGFDAELEESWQRGNNTLNARTAGDRKLSKEEEMAVADSSPIFRKYMAGGWKFVVTIHAAARAWQRRPEYEFAQWKLLHDMVAKKVSTWTKFKPTDNKFLFYSNKMEQGYICELYPDTKTLRIITVLPKGRSLVTQKEKKVLVESFGDLDVYTIDMTDSEE